MLRACLDANAQVALLIGDQSIAIINLRVELEAVTAKREELKQSVPALSGLKGGKQNGVGAEEPGGIA